MRFLSLVIMVKCLFFLSLNNDGGRVKMLSLTFAFGCPELWVSVFFYSLY